MSLNVKGIEDLMKELPQLKLQAGQRGTSLREEVRRWLDAEDEKDCQQKLRAELEDGRARLPFVTDLLKREQYPYMQETLREVTKELTHRERELTEFFAGCDRHELP
jgi:hypothetical protein